MHQYHVIAVNVKTGAITYCTKTPVTHKQGCTILSKFSIHPARAMRLFGDLKMYKITYTYDNPGGAGPFKGRAVANSKHSKGDSYYGPFGRATVATCSKVKTP